MKYQRMPIEVESPEEYGYEKIKNNLSESSVTDQSLNTLGLKIPDLTLLYTEHRGSSNLRSLIAEDAGVHRNDVLVTSGAAGGLFIIATSILGNNGEPQQGPSATPAHLVVVRPNYATNLETPKAIGCEITFVDLLFDSGFQLDIETVKQSIKPNTKLVSVTCPHNPSGASMSRETMDQLVELTKTNGLFLLVDETYREISFVPPLPVAASLGDHVISVGSLSKAFGVPGIRIGWIMTRNKVLQETFLAAKEQINISGSVIDEWIAEQILSQRSSILQVTMSEMKARLDMVEAWIKDEDLLEWVKPTAGVVCFPRMKKEPEGGTKAFYDKLLGTYATYVAPGRWFDLSDTYFRVGYGWPSRDELKAGMEAISRALREGHE